MLPVLMPKVWIWQSPKSGRVLNMCALHNVLNMPWQSYGYISRLYMAGSEYARVTQSSSKYASKYGWIWFWICVIQYIAQGHSTS